MTMKKIAEMAGVSRPAVSTVLGNSKSTRVSAKTRKKVLHLAKPPSKEPDAGSLYVQVCEGLGRQHPSLLGSGTTMKQRLASGQVLLGLAQALPAAGIVESMACGWDFIWIDGQHGQIDYNAMLDCQRTADSLGLLTMLRVPTHEPGLLGLYADVGSSALMVPLVNSVEEAGRIIEGLCFPPLGNRSYGGGRLILLEGPEYHRQHEMVVVAQIESVEAVEAAEEIAGMEGIDVLFFSPADMRVRMGIPLGTPILEHEQSRSAMIRTAKAARKAGKYAGTVAGDGPLAQAAVEMGYQLIAGGGDAAFLRAASQTRLNELQTALNKNKKKGRNR